MNQLQPSVNKIDHIHGNPDAIIELVEYGDYECPFCGRAYPIVKRIQQKMGADLKFVFRNFPISKIHLNAFSAAVATEAAARQDKFWEMHDAVFENQKRLDPASVIGLAKDIGLDMQRFRNDIEAKELATKVEKDFESGLRSGVNRTPSFFINGSRYEGSWEEDQFLPYLQNHLTGTAITRV